MDNENEIRKGRHCAFLMHAHLVFVTKYRRGVFTKGILDDLRSIFAGVCADFEAQLATLHAGKFDLVTSDMAPKTSGIKDSDEARSLELARLALRTAQRTLSESPDIGTIGAFRVNELILKEA